MVKKRRVTKKTHVSARQTPAMYPPPAPVELATSQKIVAVDLKTKTKTNTITLTIEGTQPPEMSWLGKPEDWLVKIVAVDPQTNSATLECSLPPEKEKWRLNLLERLKQYARNCLIRIAPHWGERPKHISSTKWRDLEQRVQVLDHLPENAPAEAHDALLALHTLNRLVAELVVADDWPESIDRAICYAIDLGQLLQRGQSQIDYGETVDRGQRNAQATAGATAAKRTKKTDRSELARAEFVRRMATVNDSRMKTATLKNMAAVKDADGTTPKWGSLATLTRWSRGWKSITPSE